MPLPPLTVDEPRNGVVRSTVTVPPVERASMPQIVEPLPPRTLPTVLIVTLPVPAVEARMPSLPVVASVRTVPERLIRMLEVPPARVAAMP